MGMVLPQSECGFYNFAHRTGLQPPFWKSWIRHCVCKISEWSHNIIGIVIATLYLHGYDEPFSKAKRLPGSDSKTVAIMEGK